MINGGTPCVPHHTNERNIMIIAFIIAITFIIPGILIARAESEYEKIAAHARETLASIHAPRP